MTTCVIDVLESPVIENYQTVKKIRDEFKNKVGSIYTYRTNNAWITKERLVEIESIYDHFMIVNVISNGRRLYRESINFLSILDGSDKLEYVV